MIKPFSLFCEELKHSKGTYSSLNLSPSSSNNLFTWCQEHIKGDLTPKDQYHVTLVYSRKGIPEAKNETIDLPLTVKAVGWDIFPTQDGDKCLVLRVESPELHKLHKLYREKYGATYDYDEYKPHVTVSYKFKGEEPREVPDVTLEFDKHTFKGLDPDWKDKISD